MSGTAASPHFPCETCEVRDKTICAALNDDELRQLNAIATAVKVRARGTVFYEGDDSTYLFNVVTGAVRLTKLLPDGRCQVTGFLFPGDLLGLAVTEVYAYSAEALTDASLCRFARTSLTAIMERFPKLEHRLLGLASNELAQAQEHLMILGRKTATERVATVLLKLAKRIGQQVAGGRVLDLPMTRQDIADYSGLTTETVSRIISRLRQDGVIQTPNPTTVHIPETDALVDISGDV